MRKGLSIILMGLFSPIFAQNTTDFSKEIDDIKINISNLYKEIQAVKQENLYYKKTLDIGKPIAQNTVNGLEFTIIDAKGSKKDKTLKVTYLYKNILNQERKSYQASHAYIVDDRGNQTNTYEVFATKSEIRNEHIQPNIPIKTFIKFNVDETDFPIIKILNLVFSYQGNQFNIITQNAVFKDIPVKWE